MESAFEQALETRTRDVLENCTACGRCVEVCPMPGPAGISGQPQTIAAGILALLRGETYPDASAR